MYYILNVRKKTLECGYIFHIKFAKLANIETNRATMNFTKGLRIASYDSHNVVNHFYNLLTYLEIT